MDALSLPPSDDPRAWQQILAALLEMVQSQQSQIQALADDRKLLEDHIRHQSESAADRARLVDSHFSQLKREEDMVRQVHTRKSNLIASIKEREALILKKQLDLAETDLEDFRVCVESLTAEIIELKEKLNCRETDKGKAAINDLSGKDPRVENLEREIKKLKNEHKKLISKKDADISALVAEKDFVWNQFKKIDEDYTALVNSKKVGSEQAELTIQVLQNDLENLHSVLNEKDAVITNLETERTRHQSDIKRHTREAEELNKQMENLRRDVEDLQSSAKEKDVTIVKLRSDLAKFETGSFNCRKTKPRLPKNSDCQERSKKDLTAPSGSQTRRTSGKSSSGTDKGQKRRLRFEESSEPKTATRASLRGLERCSQSSPTPVETPRLFSAKLRVPKLKNPSS